MNQGPVIPPSLSKLPAKIDSMEGLPLFPLRFAEEKTGATLSFDLKHVHGTVSSCPVGQLKRLCGLPRALPHACRWPSDRWRLCILGCGAVHPIQPVSRLGQTKQTKKKKKKSDSTSKRETWPRSTNRAKYAGGKQNKHDRDGVCSWLREGWIGLGGNLLPRKLIGKEKQVHAGLEFI